MDRSPPRGRGASVHVADHQRDVDIDPVRWAALATAVLDELGVAPPAVLGIAFVDEDAIAELHEENLGLTGPTDVLSFPVDGEGAAADMTEAAVGAGGAEPHLAGPLGGLPEGPEPWLLGDVVVCPAVAARQAAHHAGTVDDELALLVVHGLLHLLGLDHASDHDRAAMQAWERALLARHHGPLARDPWAA